MQRVTLCLSILALALATGCQTSTDEAAGMHAGGGSYGGGSGWAAADAGAGAWEDPGYGGAGGGGGAGEWGGGGYDGVPASPLEGGAVDDNADLEGYLEYVGEFLEFFESAGQAARVHWLDVSRRQYVTVTDAEGHTVPDAPVEVLDDEGQIQLRGRTLADGRFALFPRAFDISDDVPLTVTVGEARAAVPSDGDLGLVWPDAPEPDGFAVDVAFVVDATGSMSEEIRRLTQTVREIAVRLSDTRWAPDLRFGLVSYRDRGDDYVVRHADFTRDMAAFDAQVAQLRADGGGDTPEALNEALDATLHTLQWRERRALRMVFVIADAPAHHYDDAQFRYDHAMREANQRGIKVVPVASGGSDGVAEFQFRQLAQFTQAPFIFITEGGGSSSGSGGSDYEVDPQDFQVERLDALLVRLVEAEMAAWHGEAADEGPSPVGEE